MKKLIFSLKDGSKQVHYVDDTTLGTIEGLVDKIIDSTFIFSDKWAIRCSEITKIKIEEREGE